MRRRRPANARATAGRSAKRRVISSLRLQVRLGVRQERAARVVERRPLADAVKDVEHALVFPSGVENSIGGAYRNGERSRDRHRARQARLVLSVEVPPEKEREPVAEGLFQARRARLTVRRTEAPQPFRERAHVVEIDSCELIARDVLLRPARLPFRMPIVAVGENPAEVLVSLARRDIEPEPSGFLSAGLRARRLSVDRHLAADDEPDARFLCGLEGANHPVQAVAVGHAERVVAELRRAPDDATWATSRLAAARSWSSRRARRTTYENSFEAQNPG